MSRIEMSIGSVWNRWTILEEAGRNSSGSILYLCQCECGEQEIRRGTDLRSGKSNQCQWCRHRSTAKHASVKPINGTYLTVIEHGAKARGMEVHITVQDLANQWELQQGKCALSGRQLTLKHGHFGKKGTASIDRIDSNRGYHSDNIQWLDWKVNQAKMDTEESEFLQMCEDIVNHRNQVL